MPAVKPSICWCRRSRRFTLAETVALDSPLDLLDSLLFVLSPMLEALLSKAMNRAYALRSMRLVLAA